MKLRYHIRGTLVFEMEGDSPKDLFRMLSDVQSAFEADTACGRCDSTSLQYRVRVAKDRTGKEVGDYHEIVCVNCGATLTLGERRDGTLYAKRKDADGNTLDKRGWREPWGKVEREPEYAEGRDRR